MGDWVGGEKFVVRVTYWLKGKSDVRVVVENLVVGSEILELIFRGLKGRP